MEKSERERIFWAIISALGRPTSYLDVGCGDGWLVRAARQIGCNPALGIGTWQDRMAASKYAKILPFEVCSPFQLDCKLECRFGLVVALLVPVHQDNLVRHVLPGGHVVVSDYANCELELPLHKTYTERLRAAVGSSSYKVYHA